MAKLAQLKFNDLAPDLEVLTAAGESIHLSTLWSERVLILFFVRHFGCPQCKEMLDVLLQAKMDMDRAGLEMAAVTQGTPEQALAFCQQRLPGVQCLADPERKVYRAYGLDKGSLWQVLLSPGIWAANRRAARKGYKTEMPPPGQSTRQMSGVFVIGTDGRIRLPYYYSDISDHPPAELLLEGFLGMSWEHPFNTPIHEEKPSE
jgi:peroxiredoxin